jgi:HAD superfamily hydrolase (TIGR01548 family)
MKPLLIFDMDGVLAEVTESYRAGIVVTVQHFSGRLVDNALIQHYKNQGGWNNDWALSQKICADFGVHVDYHEVVRYFSDQFFGDRHRPGLILRETWIPRDGLLTRLAARYGLGIFTGRDRAELRPTLARFAPDIPFAPILCAEDVAHPKPAPDGLLLIAQAHPGRPIFYVGDTIDDARSAQAAGVPFIGISAPAGERREELHQLFTQAGAIAILDDVNQIEEVLPQ